jgi:hypothetical protein
MKNLENITLELRGGGKTVTRILKGAHATPNKLKIVVGRMYNELTTMDDVVPVVEALPAPTVEQEPVPPQLPEPARPEIPPGKIEQ